MTALYVHIPFCETKCPYCDFNSFAVEGLDVDGYLETLSREMDARGVPSNPSTIFIGGGTPTVVTPEQLDRYLTDILARVSVDPQREFTVEANPGSISAEKFEVLRSHGVNRVSLGAQALVDRHLRTMGRVHDVADIEVAVELAKNSGIPRLSLDLIYGIPGMQKREWIESLERAIAWDPGHFSCYALIYEPGTEFTRRKRRGQISPIGEEDELFLFRWTERRLRAEGYARYEISNFSRPGLESEHNLNYWHNNSYAGYGAGAFSFEEGRRFGNERRLDRYTSLVNASGLAAVSEESLEREAAARETVSLGLRMAIGVCPADIEQRFGINFDSLFAAPLRELEGPGLIVRDPNVRLARRGWRVADAVAAAFL
jgi:putative oxygen-independent coproporphyrinogen III oxidase